jgi:glycosyltransferase involved in cell wall biosynthesis
VTSTPVDAVVTYDPLKTGVVAYCAARVARAPLIVEVNGDYTAEANYIDIANPVVRRLKRSVFVRLQRFILRRASGIKLLYPTQIDAFRSALRDPVVRAFPDFVGWQTFRDLGESSEILFVGFPFRLKGVDILIAAFKQVADEFPDWRLKILGWFPDRRPLDAAIDGHPRIVFHPPVFRRELPEHVGRCGVFVLPSRTEAMGRVLIEAMACAKPCIGTRVGGIPHVIVDGETGLLVRADDVGDLADALRRLMRDAALRRRLGTNGRRRVEREFAVPSYVAHVRNFYRSVLSAAQHAQTQAHLGLAWISSWAAAAPEAYHPGLML